MFDLFSFGLGIIVVGVLLLGWRLFKPLRTRFRIFMRRPIRGTRVGLTANLADRYHQHLLYHVQGLHLAAPLFPLDEIAVEPRLLAPPKRFDPTGSTITSDVISITLPYLPDWPEIASEFHAHTMTIATALQGGANLAIIGQPGSGKTVALAHIISKIVRNDEEINDLAEMTPFLIHAADLPKGVEGKKKIIVAIAEAVAEQMSAIVQLQLTGFVRNALKAGKALILLDGLDEMVPERYNQVLKFMSVLLNEFPQTRIIVTAQPTHLPGLTNLGLIPIPLAGWNEAQRIEFIEKWGEMWAYHIVPEAWARKLPYEVNSTLANGWMHLENLALTPLELTLKIWALYMGDITGARGFDAIRSYADRMCSDINGATSALETLAHQMVSNMQPHIPVKEASGKSDLNAKGIRDSEEPDEAPDPSKQADSSAVQRIIPDMVERGLLTTRANALIGFTHPVIAGYFAGNALAKRRNGTQVSEQPDWIGKQLALRYSAVTSDVTPLVKKFTRDKDDLLQKGLLTVARWPRETGEEKPWRIEILRRLAQALQNDRLPLGIRARVTAALISSADDGITLLFRQMLTSPDSRVRQLIAMGLGVLKDPKSVNDLNMLLDDSSPAVQRAACLGLVANGSLPAIEAVAYALLHHASEETRRAAAEALANHLSEGHPILKEASKEKDLMVRRAVVYGLGRIDEDWSKEILLKLQLEDEQWVVRSAAGEVLDNMVSDPHIPKRLPPLSESSWLIQFASLHGMGIPKGQGAWDMIYKALKEGKEDDNIAAMEYLRQVPERAVEVIPDLYKHFYASKGDLQEAALNTIWYLVAAGIELPSPQQFGYS